MREETLKKLTTSEKFELCELINANFNTEVMATFETLPFFKSEPVFQLVKKAARKYPNFRVIESKLYSY